MNNIVEIKGVKSFDLNIPTQAIDFLIQLGVNGKGGFIHPNEIVNRITDYISSNYTQKILDDKYEFSEVFNDIHSFFIFFIIDTEYNNVFYKYLISNNTDSDIVKKFKINNLVKSLENYMDFHADFYPEEDFEEQMISLNKPIINEYLSKALPAYFILEHCQTIYDLIWEQFYVFIDNNKHKYSYLYSKRRSKRFQDIIIKKRNNQVDNQEQIELEKKENPFPDIFKNIDTYVKFINYTEKHIDSPYTDFSYLFKRLYDENLIHRQKDLYLMQWLKENEIITNKMFDDFKEIGFFKSTKKSESKDRLKYFLDIFDL